MENETPTFDKDREQITQEVLDRYSMLDLTEMDDRDISYGEAKLNRAKGRLTVIEQGETEFIRWWRIEGEGGTYEARRFENFVYCSCPDYFYARRDAGEGTKATLCKHLALTLRWYCKRCKKREANYGQFCIPCQQDTAPWLQPTKDIKPLIVGGIRVQ